MQFDREVIGEFNLATYPEEIFMKKAWIIWESVKK
jgi:hypothetical protein